MTIFIFDWTIPLYLDHVIIISICQEKYNKTTEVQVGIIKHIIQSFD